MKGNTKKNENLASQAEERSRCERRMSHIGENLAAARNEWENQQSLRCYSTSSNRIQWEEWDHIEQASMMYSHSEIQGQWWSTTTMRMMGESSSKRLCNTAYSGLQVSWWSSNKSTMKTMRKIPIKLLWGTNTMIRMTGIMMRSATSRKYAIWINTMYSASHEILTSGFCFRMALI